jgi:hypothetical protein
MRDSRPPPVTEWVGTTSASGAACQASGFGAIRLSAIAANGMPHCDRENLNRGPGKNPITFQYINLFRSAIGCDHTFMSIVAVRLASGRQDRSHCPLQRFRQQPPIRAGAGFFVGKSQSDNAIESWARGHRHIHNRNLCSEEFVATCPTFFRIQCTTSGSTEIASSGLVATAIQLICGFVRCAVGIARQCKRAGTGTEWWFVGKIDSPDFFFKCHQLDAT